MTTHSPAVQRCVHEPDCPMTNVDYLKALLGKPRSSVEHTIGTAVSKMSDNQEVLDYLDDLMTTNEQNSRAYEIASDVWALTWRAAA